MPDQRLARDFFAIPAAELAPALLGMHWSASLTTAPASPGESSRPRHMSASGVASHAFNAERIPRNEPMYACPGTAYVYFTYGMHWCFNVICTTIDIPEAVLIRVQPYEGIDEMRRPSVAACTILTSAVDPLASARPSRSTADLNPPIDQL